MLDLGCGSGEDTAWLSARGCEVVAVDASAEMLAVTAAKAPVTTVHVDLNGSDARARLQALGRFDAIVSGFGVLNCVADRRQLVATLGSLLDPGGAIALAVMGPWCAWEILVNAARLRPGAALRRLRRAPMGYVGEDVFPVWYPTAATLTFRPSSS